MKRKAIEVVEMIGGPQDGRRMTLLMPGNEWLFPIRSQNLSFSFGDDIDTATVPKVRCAVYARVATAPDKVPQYHYQGIQERP